MRRLGAVALVALAGLAGCLGGGSGDLAQTGTPPSQDLDQMFAYEAPERVEMTGCTEHRAVVPFPASAIASNDIPDGFSSQDRVHIVARDCQAASGLDAVAPTFAQFGLVVTPPEEMAREDALHFIDFGTVHQDVDAVAAFQAWNLFAVRGEVNLETPAEAEELRIGHARSQQEGFVVDVYSEVTAPAEDLSSQAARHFAVEDGNVTNAVDAVAADGQVLEGQAELTFEGTRSPSNPVSLVAPPPTMPGTAEHRVGENYRVTYSYVPLGNSTGG